MKINVNWRIFLVRIRNSIFIRINKIKYELKPHKKLNILFSNKLDWKDSIRSGLSFTDHEVYFDNFIDQDFSKFDLIVPLTIDDILYLNTQQNKILNNAIPIPNKESVLLCDDKDAFNTFLISNGFSDYIPTTGVKLKFPYILKKKVDVWGANSFIIDNKNKELEFEDKINNIGEYFTQELILGKTEYATHILCKKNRIVYSLNVKYTFANDMPIKGKDKPLFMTIISSHYLDLFSTILELINFEGLCCFNYKIVNGKPLIFEINPRFGGSLCPFFFTFLDHINTKKPT